MMLTELMSEYRAFELEQIRPSITAGDLRSGHRYTIFLDEFDKANATEFASRKLFELLNAVRDYEHQLLVTSNKDWNQLRAIWSKADASYGDSIMKRLEQCQLIEMF